MTVRRSARTAGSRRRTALIGVVLAALLPVVSAGPAAAAAASAPAVSRASAAAHAAAVRRAAVRSAAARAAARRAAARQAAARQAAARQAAARQAAAAHVARRAVAKSPARLPAVGPRVQVPAPTSPLASPTSEPAVAPFGPYAPTQPVDAAPAPTPADPQPVAPSPLAAPARPVAPEPGLPAPDVPTPTPEQGYEAELLRLANVERRSAGLPDLMLSACASTYAGAQAMVIAAAGALSHQPLGPVLSGCGATAAGENVASGGETPAATMAMWMASAPHRANLLNPAFTALGSGARRGATGHWFAAQVFVRHASAQE